MNNINFLTYNYRYSNSVVARGKRQVDRYKKEGYYILRGGNGSYVMYKPSIAEITYELNGNVTTQSVKEKIRNYYGIEKVTENKLEEFYDDCVSGKVDFLKI